MTDTALSRDEQLVWSTLRRHVGRGQAIGLSALAERAGVSDRVVQDVIAHLIERHGFAIGSAVKRPMGYYLIETGDELDESVKQLRHRLIALAKRIAALRKHAAPLVLRQVAIDLEEEQPV